VKNKNGNLTMMLRACFVLALMISMSLPTYAQTTAEQAKSEIENAALRFFLVNAHPITGIVRDKADNFQPDDNRIGSIAATGFGITIIANAASRGLIDRQFGKEYVLKTLTFIRDHVDDFHGWKLHWIDWETGKRVWQSEYSTIDTAFVIAGGLYAAKLFDDPEISKVSHDIYNKADFLHFMTDGGSEPDRRTLTLSYSIECGYAAYQWSIYAEQMLLLILGMGQPDHPLPAEVWSAWNRIPKKVGNKTIMGGDMPLFVHQYTHLFIDFQKFQDASPNYFENSVLATAYNRDIAVRDQKRLTFQAGFWGLSAGEAPNEIGYGAFGPGAYDGTVCLSCTIGSVMFLPDLILNDAANWLDSPYRKKIWGKFGFIDSLNIDKNFFSTKALAITVGTEYLSLANMDENTSVWRVFGEIPEIRTALNRARLAFPPPSDVQMISSPSHSK
jgi:hypothetical protein